ncbi:hypothetical protein SESBI_47988 [Sesbania bispinosa]|nr:hypothetical protein SESBI_47988 [Sesbania bispinosa]
MAEQERQVDLFQSQEDQCVDMQVQTTVSHDNTTSKPDSPKPVSNTTPMVQDLQPNSPYGPWMLVKKQPHNKQKIQDSSKGQANNQGSQGDGSRFSLLTNLDQETHTVP